MSPKRTAEYKEGQRGEIMAAARRLFVESGYDRATLREIAREAGVSTGAIYTYFRTKAELLAAICREQAAVQEATLREALASLPPEGDRFAAAFRVALAPFLEASGEEARRRELVNLLFWYEATRDPAVGEEMRNSLDASHAAVLAGLREERAAGRLREDFDLDALAAMLVALPFGLQIQELLRGESLDREAFLGTAGELLRAGLEPPENGKEDG